MDITRKRVVIITTERKTNETEFDYHKRLIYGKLVDKTLADIDYTELAEIVYGQPYSSDVARRMMYGSRKTLDLIDSMFESKLASDETREFMRELDAKKDEIQKERQRYFDQRREHNKLLSKEAREEYLFDRLSQAATELKETVGSLLDTGSSEGLRFSNNEAVLVFSDWHYGMVTNNVFNTYNTDICKLRVKSIVNSAVQRILLNECTRLHIVVLGDLYHGAIHASARVASEELVCDQLMQASEILAQAICELSKYVNETVVYTTYGNHARTVQNKNDSIHRDNMERIIPWWLKQRLQGHTDITISDESDNEFLFVNSCGHEICASHGDLDTARSSPKILATLFQKKYKKDIEYIILGDKHHRESFDEMGVTATVCGSLCGTDDYASDKRLFSSPSQLLLVVNAETGVDAEYRLKCD